MAVLEIQAYLEKMVCLERQGQWVYQDLEDRRATELETVVQVILGMALLALQAHLVDKVHLEQLAKMGRSAPLVDKVCQECLVQTRWA
jgi:hypothetical protein